MTATDLFRKDGASAAALTFIGGDGSALQAVWHAAILKRRGVPLFPPKVYRLVGGNQTLPDTFTQRLGSRVRLNCPVTGIEHGQSGVRVSFKDGGQPATLDADYLVCAMSARMLRAPAGDAGVPAREDVRDRQRAVLPRHARDLSGAVAVLGAGRHQPEHGVRGRAALPRVEHVRRTCTRAAGCSPGPHRARGPRTGRSPRIASTIPAAQKTSRRPTSSSGPMDPWSSACERTSYRSGGACEVLADPDRTARPHPLRGRVCGQPQLGHGGRYTVGTPGRGGDRPRVANAGA